MPSKLRNTLPFLLAFILALVLIPGVARADDALDSVEGVEETEPLELPDETEPTDPAPLVEETVPTETPRSTNPHQPKRRRSKSPLPSSAPGQ